MSLKDKRIFIVEDNLKNLTIMKTLLERDGATVDFNRWGPEAAKQIRDFAPIDVIILDLMLPQGVSGYDIFDAVRTLPECSTTPIVLVTASDADIELPKARRKGFSGFISKPIRFGLFEKQIERIIEGERIWYT